jgi:DNA primase
MRYSEETIQEVISRTNIVEVIGQYVQLKRSGSNYVGLCPFHSEKTPSFSVSPSKQMYYCFGCHQGGNVITFLMEYNNYTFKEALTVLAERAGIPLPEIHETGADREREDKRTVLLEINKKAAAYYFYKLRSQAGQKGLDYLKKRGLTDRTIQHFGLGYSDSFGDSLYRYLKKEGYSDQLLNESGLFLTNEKKGFSDKFWNRVIYPIMDSRGRVIGFGGRVMGDGKPKYLNSPETMIFNKRKNLYALNYARATREAYFILCEGYMDVITMHQAGFTNAVASLGTALTEEQANLLRRFTREILLLYDSDNAGTMAALRAAPILRNAGINSRVVRLDPYKDPDEFIKAEGAEAFQQRLDQAQNAFIFEMDQLKTHYRMDDPAEKTEFQHEIARKLTAFTETLERENYLEALSARFGFDREGLKKLVNRLFAQGTPAATYQRPKSGMEKGQKKESGLVTSQKLLMTYLANNPEAYPQIREIISPEDFTDQLCRTIAEPLFRQLRETGKANEAALTAQFQDARMQSECAALFHTSVPVSGQAELDRAFTETVMKVLKNSADSSRQGDGQTFDLQKFIEKKKLIEQIESGKKTFHLKEV